MHKAIKSNEKPIFRLVCGQNSLKPDATIGICLLRYGGVWFKREGRKVSKWGIVFLFSVGNQWFVFSCYGPV
jgi:hypothetical protein